MYCCTLSIGTPGPCLPLACHPNLRHTLCLQEAFGKAWVLYDMAILAAMLVCVISYSIYIHSLAAFQPQDTYPVYDSLGGAQARLLLPKKQEPTSHNGKTPSLTSTSHVHLPYWLRCRLASWSFTLGLTLCFRFASSKSFLKKPPQPELPEWRRHCCFCNCSV